MTYVPLAASTDLSLTGTNLTLVAVVAAIAVVSLVMAALFRKQVLDASEGTPRMQEIGRAVQEGASAYLARQFKTLGVFVVLAFLLLFILPGDAEIRVGRSIFFLVGALFSATIGYLGMWLAVRANIRVAAAAQAVPAGTTTPSPRTSRRPGWTSRPTRPGIPCPGATTSGSGSTCPRC